MKNLTFTFTTISLLLTSLFSQNQGWIIYNTSNFGLPNNNILCIAIDLNDRKWIETTSGLANFHEDTWNVY
jgi:hypothetical protein